MRKLVFGIALITMVVVSACARYCPESDFRVEAVNGGASVRIVEYVGANQVVRIPSRINRLPVSIIGKGAFQGKSLTHVTIPGSVTHIEDWAFSNNQLTGVTIANGVTHIGNGAFSHTLFHIDTGFLRFRIPPVMEEGRMIALLDRVSPQYRGRVRAAFRLFDLDNLLPTDDRTTLLYIFPELNHTNLFVLQERPDFLLEQIEEFLADAGYTNEDWLADVARFSFPVYQNQITDVVIPDSVQHIGNSAFRGNQLASVIIGNSVTYIGSGAFERNQLTYVTIPDRVASIGWGAFASNPQLANVSVLGNDTAIVGNTFGAATVVRYGVDWENWTSVSGGGRHTASIKADGTLWTWGHNEWGQLGDGTTICRHVPTQIGTATEWEYVSAGPGFTVAIKTDGTLWSWGMNSWGELGDGTTTDRHSPVRIGTEANWRSLSTCIQLTVAITTDGTLWIWGGVSRIPTQIGVDSNWKHVSVGGVRIAAIRTDGTLWFWYVGDIPSQMGMETSWLSVSVAAIWGNIVALRTDGTLWTLGWDQFYDATLIQIGTATDWAAVTAGCQHAVAIRADGSLWAWGYNRSGQLGDGAGGWGSFSDTPIQIGTATNWASITAGFHRTAAIKTNGTLWAWGDNWDGQVGQLIVFKCPSPNICNAVGNVNAS